MGWPRVKDINVFLPDFQVQPFVNIEDVIWRYKGKVLVNVIVFLVFGRF